MYRIMVADRDVYIQPLSSDSWRIGRIPAMRGRILDKSGTPLAWSIRYFSLYYTVPDQRTRIEEDMGALGTIVTVPPGLDHMSPGRSILLKEELSPGEILKLRAYLKVNRRFRIGSSFRREYAFIHSDVRRMIGRIRLIDNKEVGISGLERRYNSRLIGKDGKYRVMVDAENNWITATWEEIQPPVPGFDVYAPIEIKK